MLRLTIALICFGGAAMAQTGTVYSELTTAQRAKNSLAQVFDPSGLASQSYAYIVAPDALTDALIAQIQSTNGALVGGARTAGTQLIISPLTPEERTAIFSDHAAAVLSANGYDGIAIDGRRLQLPGETLYWTEGQ